MQSSNATTHRRPINRHFRMRAVLSTVLIATLVVTASLAVPVAVAGQASASDSAGTGNKAGKATSAPKPGVSSILKNKLLAQQREALFDALKNVETEQSARAIENAIWQLWNIAPDDKSAELLKKAMRARRWYDFAGAIKLLDELVAYAPDYSEGWNQRATVLFLQKKYDESLSDIEKTLALEPNHFGALAGRLQIFIRTGRLALARSTLKRALEVNPWLRERALIAPKTPTKEPGQKI